MALALHGEGRRRSVKLNTGCLCFSLHVFFLPFVCLFPSPRRILVQQIVLWEEERRFFFFVIPGRPESEIIHANVAINSWHTAHRAERPSAARGAGAECECAAAASGLLAVNFSIITAAVRLKGAVFLFLRTDRFDLLLDHKSSGRRALVDWQAVRGVPRPSD